MSHSGDVRVAGAEYVVLTIAWAVYVIGSFAVPGAVSPRLLPALVLLPVLFFVSLRTPWSCRVEPNQIILRFAPGGIIRRVLRKEEVGIRIATRRDWGKETREIWLHADKGVLAVLGGTVVANARFGVSGDRSRSILEHLRRHGYRMIDGPPRP